MWKFLYIYSTTPNWVRYHLCGLSQNTTATYHNRPCWACACTLQLLFNPFHGLYWGTQEILDFVILQPTGGLDTGKTLSPSYSQNALSKGFFFPPFILTSVDAAWFRCCICPPLPLHWKPIIADHSVFTAPWAESCRLSQLSAHLPQCSLKCRDVEGMERPSQALSSSLRGWAGWYPWCQQRADLGP